MSYDNAYSFCHVYSIIKIVNIALGSLLLKYQLIYAIFLQSCPLKSLKNPNPHPNLSQADLQAEIPANPSLHAIMDGRSDGKIKRIGAPEIGAVCFSSKGKLITKWAKFLQYWKISQGRVLEEDIDHLSKATGCYWYKWIRYKWGGEHKPEQYIRWGAVRKQPKRKLIYRIMKWFDSVDYYKWLWSSKATSSSRTKDINKPSSATNSTSIMILKLIRRLLTVTSASVTIKWVSSMNLHRLLRTQSRRIRLTTRLTIGKCRLTRKFRENSIRFLSISIFFSNMPPT